MLLLFSEETGLHVLITGISGFAGRHLAYLLARRDDLQVHGVARSVREGICGVHLRPVDLVDAGAIRTAVRDLQPKQVYHLAAYADPGGSFREARRVWDANLTATLNLYDACLELEPRPQILYASTGAVYGEAEQPITERTALRPNSPYAASKAAADLASYQYWASHRLPVIRVRAFNQVGPGQPTTLALGRFADQLVRMERGELEPILRVGNLEAERDYTDVRDMVRAYALLMEKGEPGEVYNAASGSSQPMRWFLDRLLEQTPAPVKVQTEAALLRPVETQHLRVEVEKLQRTTGWTAVIPIEKSLADLILETRRALPHA